jgi:hypothetical protein
MQLFPQLPEAGDNAYPELEKELEHLKDLVQKMTPEDVLQSIHTTIAACPTSVFSHSVTVSCHGTTDAGPS